MYKGFLCTQGIEVGVESLHSGDSSDIERCSWQLHRQINRELCNFVTEDSDGIHRQSRIIEWKAHVVFPQCKRVE